MSMVEVFFIAAIFAALLFCEAWRRALQRERQAWERNERLSAALVAAEERFLGVLDGTFSIGDGTAQREIERLRAGVEALRHMVDQTDPDDPIGAAMTRAGLERR